MQIYECTGFEYEKSLPNSPEDMFNESVVVYDHNGKKHTLHVTYVRYFDTYVAENNIYDAEQTGIPFYHLVALLILLKNEGEIKAQRLYFSDTEKFLSAFNPGDIPKAVEIYKQTQPAHLTQAAENTVQP